MIINSTFDQSIQKKKKKKKENPLRVYKQEFRRIVLCHQLWLKTKADEIQKDKNYAGHK